MEDTDSGKEIGLNESDVPAVASQTSGFVAARGTIDGVVIRLDGRVAKNSLFIAIEEFLSTRESFLGGSEVVLEWIGVKPDESLCTELNTLLLEKFRITVKSSKLKEQVRQKQQAEDELNLFIKQREADRSVNKKVKSLFDGMEALNSSPHDSRAVGQESSGKGGIWDEPDARLIYSTLRSGQRIETDHSLIIFGDVNSGAEIIAGGDIIVLGILRGVAHAGAYDESGGGRIIFALNLQPTQLRIGMVISRSAVENVNVKVPEIARVEDGVITVESYSVKGLSRKSF